MALDANIPLFHLLASAWRSLVTSRLARDAIDRHRQVRTSSARLSLHRGARPSAGLNARVPHWPLLACTAPPRITESCAGAADGATWKAESLPRTVNR